VNFNRCHIYIPSTARSDVNMTFLALPMEWREQTTIVVGEGEKLDYKKRFPRYANIVECPKSGIGKVRQWIIDNTDAKYVLMMDDDLRFATRVKKGEVKLRPCDQEDVNDILETLFGYMMRDKFVHVGLAKRTEASFFLCDHRIVVRQNNVHGFNVRKMRSLKRKGVRFDKMELMEDFHVTLRLFELGYPNKVLFDYTWDQRGSNYRGGCSTYRTAKAQKRAALALAEMHPGTVEVVKKEVKAAASWKDMKTRYDVRIQWRKSYTGEEDSHWELERKSIRK
jgi:glycosyltransferase involved in cell wall biosynthesis